ncbi:MAG TPA: ATPase, T2SS/T4P/T4SS family, partial [Candidatus Ozemobacteraceae bacterium]|nr:ATPase, T2SS/T4P/T4SS family [Candidatus Ozemobacteraceae bacterium]
DPVEYNLMGINQVQCHADIGLDFSAALRSFLRQDPNVIMIGEIRDFETASIAIKAAMTGHLVISTLHTNDAPSTIARLMNMGIEPFGITTSIRIVQAQRLVRKICKSCYTEYKPNADLIQTLKVNQKLIDKIGLTKDIDISNLSFAKGAGCPDCDQTGCKGRIGVYEVLSMTQSFREVVERRGTPEELRRQALKDGMLSLRESAMFKLLTKKTTVEEIYRTTMEAGDLDEEALEREIVKKKGKLGAQANVVEGGAGVVASVPEIGGLMKEMEAFRSTLDRIAGGPAKIESISGELLRQNLTDPLTQLQAQITAGMAGQADVSKLLPSIQAQSQKMDFNLRNLTWHFSSLQLKPASLDVAQFLEKNILSQLKQHVLLARILSGKPTIGQGLKITKNFAPGLPPIAVDAEAFRAVAVNITINSLMAFSQGGELKLVTRLKPQTNNRVEVVFFDNGAGIPSEAQTGLYTPFAPIGRPTLGLGLAVSRKLVQAMNGQISLKSMPGANTLVVLDFPSVSV